MSFKQKVISIVKQIPKGMIMTYSDVAKKAGSPGAARAVGTIMSQNKDLNVPCHRVVRKDKIIGSYNGLRGPDKKTILIAEGAL